MGGVDHYLCFSGMLTTCNDCHVISLGLTSEQTMQQLSPDREKEGRLADDY